MCLAILNKKKVLSRSVFDNAAQSNNDGYGLLYVDPVDGRLSAFRATGIKVKQFYKKYLAIRNCSTMPVVIHFRLGTSGRKDLLNCHPFFVNKKLGFVHNGIINIKEIDKFSDTHTFNVQVLRKLGADFLDNNALRFLIESTASSSKLVFLHDTGRFDILNESQGHWDEEKDTWYSNSCYKETSYGFGYYGGQNATYYPGYKKDDKFSHRSSDTPYIFDEGEERSRTTYNSEYWRQKAVENAAKKSSKKKSSTDWEKEINAIDKKIAALDKDATKLLESASVSEAKTEAEQSKLAESVPFAECQFCGQPFSPISNKDYLCSACVNRLTHEGVSVH